MKTIPKFGLITLLAIGLCIGFFLATETIVVKMIQDSVEPQHYMEEK